MKISLLVLTFVALPRLALADLVTAPSGQADEIGQAGTVGKVEPKDTRHELPFVAYTYTAYGSSAKTVGARGYTLGLLGAGQDRVLGGGASIWGAPTDRLTLIVDAQRNLSRDFSPSAAAIFRFYGDGGEGITLGGLGKFKIDGFGKGPDGDEVESEAELGALVSLSTTGWHLDANAIGGRGLGDDGEVDGEGRLRIGRDIASWANLAIDSQARVRLAGPLTLPNGRTWDFAAGLQALACVGNFFGSFTAGPTTMGLVTKNVGLTAMLAVGGAGF